MWHSADVLELSYATLYFKTQEIVWKDKGFTPRRHKVLEDLVTGKTKFYTIKWYEELF